MTTNHGRVVTYFDGLLPKESHDLARSHDKLKSLSLVHSACGHQTWQDDQLP